MKIKKIEAIPVWFEPTDEGIVGRGEASAHPVTSETQQGIVSTVELFARQIIGRDPFEIGAIHAALDHLFLQGNAGARCAIDDRIAAQQEFWPAPRRRANSGRGGGRAARRRKLLK